jgi:hypothetical protein
MKQAPLTPKRWRRVEYQRLVDVGAFDREPLELIGAQLIVAEPKGSQHAAAVDMAYVAYRDPAADLTAPYGWRSTSMERARPPATVTPLGVPAPPPIPVASLLPGPV